MDDLAAVPLPVVACRSGRAAAAGGGPGIQPSTSYRISAPADLPTRFGMFRIRAFRDPQGKEHALISLGELAGGRDVALRIHSQCLTSEVFGCLRCDCRGQFDAALAYIAAARSGLILYLRQEGRGIGLFNKIEAYALQDGGLDTVDANHALGFPDDCRSYEAAVDLLGLLQIRSVRLLTNNPRKLQGLCDRGVEVTERVPLHVEPNAYNSAALRSAKRRLNHFL
jgi:3,4-dihydroxy 2-butanone 4-phosphate synthase/GTP cyclohydrolase II